MNLYPVVGVDCFIIAVGYIAQLTLIVSSPAYTLIHNITHMLAHMHTLTTYTLTHKTHTQNTQHTHNTCTHATHT